MKNTLLFAFVFALFSLPLQAKTSDESAEPNVSIEQQRQKLHENTAEKGFGPQSPRDLNSSQGENRVVFNPAPAYDKLNLCNIHFHKGAEHSGGEFTKFVGEGDGQGNETGFVYAGKLSDSELMPVKPAVCQGENTQLQSGDTIELHYVFSSAKVKPGPTLGACLSDAVMNPQLRVEAQILVLVNDRNALDFQKLTQFDQVSGLHQAVNIPKETGDPVVYTGSTTGPAFNTQGSPLKVTWSVRPDVAKVDIKTVGQWCDDNVFEEKAAHGVRNLVTNPDLLSPL